MELRDIILHYGFLPEKCIGEILQRGTELRHYEPTDFIVQQGKICRHLFLNRNGLTRVHYEAVKGDKTLLFGSEGDIYTSLSSWYTNAPANMSLSAIQPSDVYAVPYTLLNDVLSRYPEVTSWLLNICKGQLYVLERKSIISSDLNAEERCRAFFFQEQKHWVGAMQYTELWKQVPMKYIASYLGITQETLSRIRHKIYNSVE
ncbi:MAG: Crp/Fnr family transcriptional regulator [Lepagella sp.]